MSQQEDDLRALAKIMDFLRAISIVLVVANLYYFTRVETVDSGWFYTTVDKILNNFNRACGLFCNTLPSKLFLTTAPWCRLPRHQRGEEREDYLATHYYNRCRRTHRVLIQSVASESRHEIYLYRHHHSRLHSRDDGGCMDEPYAEEQYDGRPIQRGE